MMHGFRFAAGQGNARAMIMASLADLFQSPGLVLGEKDGPHGRRVAQVVPQPSAPQRRCLWEASV